jgi:pimeloyl-ACP methyl ester carboxylesterase
LAGRNLAIGKKYVKKLGWLIVLLLAIAGGVALTLQSGVLNLSLAELEQRYRLPESKFADIDGVRLHYVDEGQGPVIVLVHASFMNLHSWNDLASRLKDRYRVIRFDQLTNGLTGPDPANDYGLPHNERLLDGLLRQLGITEITLLGTSSGGTTAFRYAAAHPQQVKRLILVNSAGMPRTATTDPNRPRGSALERWVLSRYKSPSYWRESLTGQFGGGTPPPEELVQRVYDMNRRDTLRAEGAAMMKAFQTGDPEKVLGEIRVPTFVLWGKGNITVSHLEADVIQHWLINAPTLKKKIDKVGHYFYLELPEEFARDIDDFASGRLDAQMTRVSRSNYIPVTTQTPEATQGVDR